MAVIDDLNKLAAQDVVYLTRTLSVGAGGMGNGSTEVFRGRLREALNGDWVFHASTGQNGAVGFILGGVGQNSWSSSESPAAGLQITVTFQLSITLMGGMGMPGMGGPMQGMMNEVIVLTTLIPTDFAD
jgi:hypothetical protein